LLLLVAKGFEQFNTGRPQSLEDLSLSLGVVRLDVLVGDNDFQSFVAGAINLRGDALRDGMAVAVGANANTRFLLNLSLIILWGILSGQRCRGRLTCEVVLLLGVVSGSRALGCRERLHRSAPE
jgi:hypothetical protein